MVRRRSKLWHPSFGGRVVSADFWDTWDARREAEKRRVIDALPRCPACGADADADLVETTPPGGPPQVVRSTNALRCSARCWEHDPVRYLAAVEKASQPRKGVRS